MNYRFEPGLVSSVEFDNGTMYVTFSSSNKPFPEYIAISDDELSIVWSDDEMDLLERKKIDSDLYFEDGQWEIEIDYYDLKREYKNEVTKKFITFFNYDINE